jgi:hypothetical protein
MTGEKGGVRFDEGGGETLQPLISARFGIGVGFRIAPLLGVWLEACSGALTGGVLRGWSVVVVSVGLGDRPGVRGGM